MSSFELDAKFYDIMVNWDKRLKNELPFFRRILGEKEPKKILDVACGSGRHSLEFAKLNHQVLGIDVDPGMISLAKELLTRESEILNRRIDFSVVSFDDLIVDQKKAHGHFDFIVCIGNSLSLLSSIDKLSEILKAFYNRLSKKGLLILQIVNYSNKPTQWRSKVEKRPLENGYLNITKSFNKKDPKSLTMTIEVIHQKPTGLEEIFSPEFQLLIFSPEDIEKGLDASGLSSWKIFGDYQESLFDPIKSQDIIVVAQK